MKVRIVLEGQHGVVDFTALGHLDVTTAVCCLGTLAMAVLNRMPTAGSRRRLHRCRGSSESLGDWLFLAPVTIKPPSIKASRPIRKFFEDVLLHFNLPISCLSEVRLERSLLKSH